MAIGKGKKAKPILIAYRSFDSTSTGFKDALSALFWEDTHRQNNESLYRNFTLTGADTLKKVKQLKADGKIGTSYQLLTAYYKNHSNDLNTTWLYAQIAYLKNT